VRGFPVYLYFQDEVPTIGSGWRRVVCQFRRKTVVLHHWVYTARMSREEFNELIVANKRWRKRNSNVIQFPSVDRNPIELRRVA